MKKQLKKIITGLSVIVVGGGITAGVAQACQNASGSDNLTIPQRIINGVNALNGYEVGDSLPEGITLEFLSGINDTVNSIQEGVTIMRVEFTDISLIDLIFMPQTGEYVISVSFNGIATNNLTVFGTIIIRITDINNILTLSVDSVSVSRLNFHSIVFGNIVRQLNAVSTYTSESTQSLLGTTLLNALQIVANDGVINSMFFSTLNGPGNIVDNGDGTFTINLFSFQATSENNMILIATETSSTFSFISFTIRNNNNVLSIVDQQLNNIRAITNTASTLTKGLIIEGINQVSNYPGNPPIILPGTNLGEQFLFGVSNDVVNNTPNVTLGGLISTLLFTPITENNISGTEGNYTIQINSVTGKINDGNIDPTFYNISGNAIITVTGINALVFINQFTGVTGLSSTAP